MTLFLNCILYLLFVFFKINQQVFFPLLFFLFIAFFYNKYVYNLVYVFFVSLHTLHSQLSQEHKWDIFSKPKKKSLMPCGTIHPENLENAESAVPLTLTLTLPLKRLYTTNPELYPSGRYSLL